MSAQPPIPPSQGGGPDYQKHAQEAMARVKAASQDALKTFMTLIYNPVGALPGAFNSLPGSAALGVGIVFMVVWLICTILGVMFGAPVPIPFSGLPASIKFKILFLMLCLPIGMALGMFVLRKVLRGSGSLAFDVFVAGAALLMVGFAFLAAGVLANLGSLGGRLAFVVMMVAFVLSVLVIYTALTRVSGIKEGIAAYVVAGVYVVAGFFVELVSKILM